jgi:type I restriction enzyme M protein
MSAVDEKPFTESAWQYFDALRHSGISGGQIREIFAAFFVLRWSDHQDAEQEAMAVFDDQHYQPLLPPALQWRHLMQLKDPDEIASRMRELVHRLDGLRGDAWQPMNAWLHMIAAPLRRLLNLDRIYLRDLVHWVGGIRIETPDERRALLLVFDRILTDSGDAVSGYGQYSSPGNIARLVAALANPQPGERVYDPCFGSGNFLIAAWQHAERSRNARSRPGPLLEVAGIELAPHAFLIGLTRMLLAGVDAPHLELGNSLEREPPSSTNREGFDVVLANPPIGAKVSRDLRLYHHYTYPSNEGTSLFIQHALSQLKPHGRAVIAVSEGFLFRSGPERELRRDMVEKGQVEAVIGLPAGTLAPYTGVKVSLLVLSSGGASHIKMADATPFFEPDPARKSQVIRAEKAAQLAGELRRASLHTARELSTSITEDAPGMGLLSRSIWEISANELAATEWDLSPRRREEGGLDELLATLKEALGETGSINTVTRVAKITRGRYLSPRELLNKPPNEHSVGYIRTRDIIKGKIGRCSSWLTPRSAEVEQLWSLRTGDVLLSRSGTIGKAALVSDGEAGSIAASGLYVLRADENQINPGFLLAYLASPVCQNWLSAHSRGAVQQHLSRGILEGLPVPQPPLQLQARAAAEFRQFGTDALAFLTQATGTAKFGRGATWLAELSNRTSLSGRTAASVGLSDISELLHQLESLAVRAYDARQWIEQEETGGPAARLLLMLTAALSPLSGITQIPPGPGLLTVLQKAERGMWDVLEKATGKLLTESQVRAVAEGLHDYLRAAIKLLIQAGDIRVRSSPTSLIVGSFAEFVVELENAGSLPLRDFEIRTSPAWGSGKTPYLAERGVLPLNLHGDAPKRGRQLALQLHWSARNLADQPVEGVVELAIQVVEAELSAATSSAVLGGSPYVTGSPLEPHHGHEVFFGRDDVIEQISRQIATHGNVVLLEGNRRAGKTSILKHLEGRTAIPGWLAVYSSLQSAEGAAHARGVPTQDVFRQIALDLTKGVAELGIDTPLPDGTNVNQAALTGEDVGARLRERRRCREVCQSAISEGSAFADFRDYLEILLSVMEPMQLGLVLMLDEFDKLQDGIDNGVTSPQVPENIRFLIQTYPKFTAILTGSRRLKRLREEYWSALYGLGTSIQVTALDVQSARSVVTEPVLNKLAYSNEAIERVTYLTARQPFLLQCLCNSIFQYAAQTKSRSITIGIVNDAAGGLVRNNEHFASLWDYAGRGPETGRRRRQLILVLCATSLKQGTHVSFGTLHEQLAQAGVDVNNEALDADLTYLRELELVDFSGEIGDGHYCLAIPLMAEWIEQHQDASVVSSWAHTEAEEENA